MCNPIELRVHRCPLWSSIATLLMFFSASWLNWPKRFQAISGSGNRPLTTRRSHISAPDRHCPFPHLFFSCDWTVDDLGFGQDFNCLRQTRNGKGYEQQPRNQGGFVPARGAISPVVVHLRFRFGDGAFVHLPLSPKWKRVTRVNLQPAKRVSCTLPANLGVRYMLGQ